MKKISLSLILIFFFIISFAQLPWLTPNSSYGTIQKRQANTEAFMFPTGCGTPVGLNALDIGMAAQYFDSCSGIHWDYNPSTKLWQQVGAGSPHILDVYYPIRSDSISPFRSTLYLADYLRPGARLINADSITLHDSTIRLYNSIVQCDEGDPDTIPLYTVVIPAVATGSYQVTLIGHSCDDQNIDTIRGVISTSFAVPPAVPPGWIPISYITRFGNTFPITPTIVQTFQGHSIVFTDSAGHFKTDSNFFAYNYGTGAMYVRKNITIPNDGAYSLGDGNNGISLEPTLGIRLKQYAGNFVLSTVTPSAADFVYLNPNISVFSSPGFSIGTTSAPAASAALDVTSTARGLLIPRMTTTQRNAISSPATSLLIYNTTLDSFQYYKSGWKTLGGSGGGGSSGWNLTGNSGTTAGTNFIGTTDHQPLIFKVDGTENGWLDVDDANVSWGIGSLGYTNYLSQSFTGNTAIGAGALGGNITGNLNTGIGRSTGGNNTSGSYNTYLGFNADAIVDGISNATAIGANCVVSQSNSLILGDTSNTKVGIGTTIPQTTLHVVGDGSNTAAFMNGNVGIGTTTPSGVIDAPYPGTDSRLLYDPANSTGRLTFDDDDNGLLIQGGATKTITLKRGGQVSYLSDDNGTYLEPFSGKNVGVGKNNPDEALDVVGKIKTNNALVINESEFRTVKITLTPSNIYTLSSVPFLAIPAPGASKAIEVISASARMVFNTAPYDSQSIIKITYSQNDYYNFNNFDITESSSISDKATQLDNNNTFIQNEAINISATSDNSNGDSNIDIYIYYRIISL